MATRGGPRNQALLVTLLLSRSRYGGKQKPMPRFSLRIGPDQTGSLLRFEPRFLAPSRLRPLLYAGACLCQGFWRFFSPLFAGAFTAPRGRCGPLGSPAGQKPMPQPARRNYTPTRRLCQGRAQKFPRFPHPWYNPPPEGAMIPVHLRLEGFLSYRHPAELDFSAFSLACISGPNGAGKSSLLDALTWALFGQARRRDDAIIHRAADAARVAFTFELAGARYRVQRAKSRNKPQRLDLQIWDPEHQTWRALSERRVRDTQAKIEALLGLDYTTFVQASFFLQGQADNFARQTPAARKQTLARVLGLDQWEVFHDRARQARRAAETDLARLERDLAETHRLLEQKPGLEAQRQRLQNELDEVARQREHIDAALRAADALRAQLDAARQQVEATARAVQEAQAEVRRAQSQLDALQAELAALETALTQKDAVHAAQERRRALQERLQTCGQKAHRYRELQARLARLQAEYAQARARLEQELAHLTQQRDEAARAHREAEALRAAQQEAQQRLDALAAAPTPEALMQQLRQLAETRGQLQSENRDLRATMEELKERLERLRAATGATCPLCGQPLTPEHRHDLMARLEAEGKALADRYRANKARLKELDAQQQELEAALQRARQAQTQRQSLERQMASRAAQIEALRAAWEAWQSQGAPRLAQVQAALQEETFAPELQQHIARLQAQMAALGYDPEEHARLEAEWQALAEHETQAQRLAEAQARYTALQARRRDWEQHLAQARQRLQQAQEAHQQARQAYEDLQTNLPDLDALQKQWHAMVQRERTLQQELGALRQRLHFLAEEEARLQALQAQRQALVQRIAHLHEVEIATGKNGVPALLIEQALPHLEAEANAILARLTDGEMYLSFRTQAAYKSPKRQNELRETLDIIVSDAYGQRPYETFSGGEAFRINFAIRLALARVLAHRAGAQVRLLVIDEGFGSQDEAGRQRLVEAINRVREQFSHILVITHIAELREKFPVRIEVEKTADGSRLRVVGV